MNRNYLKETLQKFHFLSTFSRLPFSSFSRVSNMSCQGRPGAPGFRSSDFKEMAMASYASAYPQICQYLKVKKTLILLNPNLNFTLKMKYSCLACKRKVDIAQ